MTLVSRFALAAVSLAGFAALTGCGIGNSAGPSTLTSNAIVSGHIMGGHQPINGSTVNLYAAGTTGYGSAPSLLGTATTDPNGMFTLTPTTACVDPQQLYLTATSGDPGVGASNTAIALVAALGTCSGVNGPVNVDEVTTIGAAYALAGFANMTSGTSLNIGTSSTNSLGLQHAFLNANNLVDYHAGLSKGTTAAGNGTVPAALINTLANALAACVNSTGVTSSGCSSVLVAPPAGTATATPANTWQLALNWAAYPGNNVANVYANPTAATNFFVPTVPTGTSAPTDLSVGIGYKAGFKADGVTAANFPWDVKADAGGNVWISGMGGAGLVEFDSAGNILSPNGGYGSTALQGASTRGIGIDRATSYNVWVADLGGNVFQFNPTAGTTAQVALPTSITVGQTATTVDGKAVGLGVDSANNVLYATYDTSSGAAGTNMIGEIPFTTGTPTALQTYAMSPILNQTSTGAYFLAVDATTNTAWAGSQSTAFVFNSVTPYTNGVTSVATSASAVNGTAFDSSGNAWTVIQSSSANGGRLCRFAAGAATACSTTNQIKVPTITPPAGGTFYGLYGPRGIAIDGNNRLFVTSFTGTASIVEFDPSIYAAAPTGSTGGFLLNASGNGFNPTATNTAASGYLYVSSPRNITIDQAGAIWVGNSTSTAAAFPIVQVFGIAAPVNPVLAAGQYGVKP